MKERMKRIAALCLVSTLAMGTVLPVQAETVQDAQKQVDELQQQKDSVQAEKNSVEEELKKIATQMEETQKKLDAKQAEITQAEENLVQAKVEENTQYQSMKIRIKYMYENGNTEFIEVLAESENISDFLNKTEYISQLSTYDRDKLKEFQETVKAVEEQEAALQAEYQELNTLQTDLVDQQTQAQNLLKEKDVKLADLSSQLGSKMETLQKLVAEEKRRQEEAEAAKQQQQQQQQQQNPPAGGGSVVTPPTSGNVSSGSGYFTHPCPGMTYQSSYFGEIREFEIGGHKGNDYAAPVGTPTYAAAAGRVIIAGYSSSAGNWVVIDHGNGLVTKYMHHSSICVSAGQYVERGQQIGAVGSTGQSTGPHLHFQVEKNGVAVSPDQYF
ncbi:MAG: peptidoglycan DD-metalloendopeptidase family protein [[Ruminococcus] gnavus]|nr:peptidoglycan DD-metalloendopeptidase family protein [Mediterraneibacter gnavus]